VKRDSVLKNVSEYNSMTTYNNISAYKSWNSVMITKIRTRLIYIKLTETNKEINIYIFKTLRLNLLQDQRFRL